MTHYYKRLHFGIIDLTCNWYYINLVTIIFNLGTVAITQYYKLFNLVTFLMRHGVYFLNLGVIISNLVIIDMTCNLGTLFCRDYYKRFNLATVVMKRHWSLLYSSTIIFIHGPIIMTLLLDFPPTCSCIMKCIM